MSLLRRVKNALKQSAAVRHLVRSYRLRTGQPRWGPLVAAAGGPLIRGDRNGEGPNVLVATGGGGYLGGTRIESILAVALAMRGARPHILLCDGVLPACFESILDWYPNEARYARKGPSPIHCRSCFGPAADMYRSVGATVHAYGDLLSGEEMAAIHERSLVEPVEGIPRLVEDGVAVGEHAMAGTLRFYARATLEDPHHQAILRRFLAAARITALATRRLSEQIEFHSAVLHHGIYVPQGVMSEALRHRGVRVTTWHTAYRKKTFIFSHGDTYHHTLMSEPTSAWENMPWGDALEAQVMEYLRSRWYGTNDWIHFHRNHDTDLQSLAALGADLSKPCFGLLTNVMWDAQLHYPANAFPDMLAWIRHTVDWFAQRPHLQLIIRVHPAEVTGTLPSRQRVVSELARAYPVLPKNVCVVPPESGLSTYVVMDHCDAALIYGTKTGVELAAMGIPVIVAGEAWIRNKGISLDATSVSDYDAFLARLPLGTRMSEETTRRARKYAFHFFFRRMIPLDFIEPARGAPGFAMRLASPEDLAPGRSRGLDVICEGILAGREFVYPAESDVAGG